MEGHFVVELPNGDARGFSYRNGSEMAVHVAVSRGLEASPSLCRRLVGLKEMVNQRLNHDSRSTKEIAGDILDIADKQCASQACYLMWLVKEIQVVGWSKLVSVSNDLRLIEFIVCDSSRREHNLGMGFRGNFPAIEVIVSADIPGNEKTKSAHPPDLSLLVSQFQGRLGKYLVLWEMLEDLDKNTWVLDPIDNLKSTLYRRIFIGKHICIQITLSLDHPKSMCECEFFGAESSVSSLRENYHRGFLSWNTCISVRENLEKILDIEFPLKTIETTHMQDECGVCYCVQLPSETGQVLFPDKICENEKCRKCFHVSCLNEWLRALTTTHYSYDSIFGKCPYCEERICVQNEMQILS